MEGVGKKLDPDINIFKESHPYLVEIFKKRYNLDRASKDLTKTLITLSSVIQGAPPQIKGILDSFESGRLKVRLEDSGAEKRAIRWETIINRLIITLLISTLALASLFLVLFGKSAWATFFSLFGFLFTGFLGFWLMLSILKSGKF
jgi:ubiquinone biosynthesis protein